MSTGATTILRFMQDNNDSEARFSAFHSEVDRFNTGLNWNNLDGAQQTLQSYSAQFGQFIEFSKRPKEDPYRRKYSLVRNAITNDIPQKIVRLTDSKPAPLDVNAEVERRERDTPSSMGGHGSPRHSSPRNLPIRNVNHSFCADCAIL